MDQFTSFHHTLNSDLRNCKSSVFIKYLLRRNNHVDFLLLMYIVVSYVRKINILFIPLQISTRFCCGYICIFIVFRMIRQAHSKIIFVDIFGRINRSDMRQTCLYIFDRNSSMESDRALDTSLFREF